MHIKKRISVQHSLITDWGQDSHPQRSLPSVGPALVRLECRFPVVPAFLTEEVKAAGVLAEPEKISKELLIKCFDELGGT